MNDSVIMCDEVIDTDAESKDGAKSYNETNFNEGKTTCKTPISFLFSCIFNNYYSIIDRC